MLVGGRTDVSGVRVNVTATAQHDGWPFVRSLSGVRVNVTATAQHDC